MVDLQSPAALRVFAARAVAVPTTAAEIGQALSDIQPEEILDGTTCMVLSPRGQYEWRASSTATPDNVDVVPSAKGTSVPGRWHLLAAGTSDGYSLPRVLWVDQNSTATGTPDGSLARPFTSIQPAIDATDETGNWQIFIAPARYQPNGLDIPTARRIRFSGLGTALNAANESNPNPTRISLLNTFVINLGAVSSTTNSDIVFENLAFEFAGIRFVDADNTTADRHRVTFISCTHRSPVVFPSSTGSNTVLDLFFDGEGGPGLIGGADVDASSVVSTLTGPGTVEVVVHASNTHFSSAIGAGISRVDLRDCVVDAGASLSGPVLSVANTPDSRALNTKFLGLIAMTSDMVMQVDAATMYSLERIAQGSSVGSFQLIDEAAWTGQPTWYVDADNGDDSNSGLTSGTALATFAELQRRWGVRPKFLVPVTVNVLSDIDESVVLRADLEGDGRLLLVGSGTTLVTGAAVTTNQDFDYTVGANGQDAQITSADVADFSIYEVLSGTNPYAQLRRASGGSDARGWVIGTVGGVGTARISRLAFAPAGNEFAASGDNFTAGQTLDVVELPRISRLTLDVQRLDSDESNAQAVVGVLVQDLVVRGDPDFARLQILSDSGDVGTGPIFYGCVIAADVSGPGAAKFVGCSIGASKFSGLPVEAVACCSNQNLQFENCQVRSEDVLAVTSSTTGTVSARNRTSMFLVGLASFDTGNAASDSALLVDEHSTLVQEGDLNPTEGVWGSGITGNGCVVNGRMWYERVSKMGVTANENVIGGVNTTNAALPAVTAANNAMIVVKP